MLLHPSNAGDRTKLDRPFTSAERQTLDTVDVTADQLAQAACTGGAQCWIAVNGVVYDLGSSPAWKDGSHHGVRAGTDATEDFVRSGHGGSSRSCPWSAGTGREPCPWSVPRPGVPVPWGPCRGPLPTPDAVGRASDHRRRCTAVELGPIRVPDGVPALSAGGRIGS